jgi:RNAse (barnase) inhibitor barstar
MQHSSLPIFDLTTANSAHGLYTIDRNQSISALLETAKNAGCKVFHLEGKQITNRDRYFKAIASQFQFEDYFGENWDALADSLTDLAWQSGDRIVIVYSDCASFQTSDAEGWDLALEIWEQTVALWQSQGVIVSVILGP